MLQGVTALRPAGAVVLAGLLLVAARCGPAPLAFAPAATSALSGSEPRQIAAADFDHDGDLDLAAVASTVPGEFTLLFNDGTGAMVDQNALDLGFACWGLAVADFDGDGHLDVATTDGQHDTSAIWMLRGDGEGGFDPFLAGSAGRFPLALAAGDYDEDGIPDLAVANNVLYGLSVLLGQGDGSFAAPLHVPGFAGTNATDVATADFDRDGHLDLSLSHYGGVQVFRGAGDGSFASSASIATYTNDGVAAADLNLDGNPDLVSIEIYAERAVVNLGRGDGSFRAATTFPIDFFAVDLAVGKVNADAWPDIVVAASNSNRVGVLRGKGNGSFAAQLGFATAPQAQSVAIGDLDGDGREDLAVGCRNQGDEAQASVLLQTP
jgi:hypothetical protein